MKTYANTSILFCRNFPAAIAVLSVLLACPADAVAQAMQKASTHATTTNTTPQNASRPAGLENPVADPKAVVVDGHARFTVLTPRLIRMEWAADGKFENHASFVFLNRKMPVPQFTHKIVKHGADQVLTLQTDALKLTYTLSPDSDGKFTSDDLQIVLPVEGNDVMWRPGMVNAGNLQGTTHSLDGARGSRIKEPIGQGLISRDGWVLVDDSKRPLFDSSDFRFTQGEKSPWPWVIERPAGNRQDWYFFGYGHDYKQALGDFVKVAGRIPLPPRFAFGAWWSRYWAYSDQELDNLVRDFHENDVPLDVLVLDMDWHPTLHDNRWNLTPQPPKSPGWGGYSWNKLLFPDPKAFLSNVHQEGLKVTLNLHPATGIQPWDDHYSEMARAMGIDPTIKQYVPLDITNKKFATNDMDIMHHPLEKQGVDFWWLDGKEERIAKMPDVNPTWWLNYVYFTDQAREGKRPLLFHRWGGLGNHRYQIGFSGDTVSVWDTLTFETWFTATAANVGYAYWSNDIGGFRPGTDDPELFTRWVQFGAFSPILRTHTSKNPEAERRIWAYPEPYSDILRSAFHLRYALVPYIYTEARRTYDTGVAFLRPLYYDWPNANEAYTAKNEYQFGSEMLVAPVTGPVDATSQLAAEPVWLPKGEWIEWETGKHFTGPIQLQRKFSIRQIPVYVSAGAIVPMAPPMEYTGQKPLDPLILTVFPLNTGASSQYTLYEDAGNTRAYQQNQAAWTTIHAEETNGDLTVTIGSAHGTYPGMVHARAYQLRLPGDWPPTTVTASGKPLAWTKTKGASGWYFEGNTLTTVITVPRTPVTQTIVVRVHRPMNLIQRRTDLDGFAGNMTRLREAYDTLNQTFPIAWSPDELIDLMQTGDRLSYHPENVSAELVHFHNVLPQAIDKVNAMTAAITPVDQRKLARKLGGNWRSDRVQKRMEGYQAKVAIALAQLQDMSDESQQGH